jgi:serine/threonine protein kinase
MNDTTTYYGLSVEDLVGQVADEFIDRLDRGEAPDVEEYVRRYPQFGVILRDVLSALQLLRRSEPAFASPADVAVPADRAGRLGDFRIVREVGRGGMGVVYEAEQISLGRRVALKVLPFAAAMDARQLVRFRTEAQAAAHLHHTNIVPVYAVGNERGVHYYAMQFIDGRTLAAVVRALRADPRLAPADAATPRAADLTTFHSATGPEFFRAAAKLAIQAAEALEHAHQMGVVHRDVKPGNLLVDTAGHLWVTDFGLARLASDPGLTRTGDLLGTLRYMSPEQTQGKPAAVDHRTDVYGLGASLYELLALEPPFRAAGRAELLWAIAEEEPVPPRRLNRTIPAELETVVLKAMAKSPTDRYATAQDLADDLRRFLDDKPVLARRPTVGQRLRRWARRHRPAVWAAVAAGVVAALTGVAALTVSHVAITGERDKARKAEADRTRQLYDALVAQAQTARLAGQLGARAEALRALEEAARLAPDPDQALRLRNEVIAARTLPDVRAEREWEGYPRGTRGVTFDADLARYARCEPDGTVTVRRVADDSEEVRLMGAVTDPGTPSLRFAAGGRHLSVVVPGSTDGSSAVWDLTTGRPCLPLRGASGAEFSPDGRRVAVRGTDGKMRVSEVATGREAVAPFIPGVSAGRGHPFAFDPAAGCWPSAIQTGARSRSGIWPASTSPGSSPRLIGPTGSPGTRPASCWLSV